MSFCVRRKQPAQTIRPKNTERRHSAWSELMERLWQFWCCYRKSTSKCDTWTDTFLDSLEVKWHTTAILLVKVRHDFSQLMDLHRKTPRCHWKRMMFIHLNMSYLVYLLVHITCSPHSRRINTTLSVWTQLWRASPTKLSHTILFYNNPGFSEKKDVQLFQLEVQWNIKHAVVDLQSPLAIRILH